MRQFLLNIFVNNFFKFVSFGFKSFSFFAEIKWNFSQCRDSNFIKAKVLISFSNILFNYGLF